MFNIGSRKDTSIDFSFYINFVSDFSCFIFVFTSVYPVFILF